MSARMLNAVKRWHIHALAAFLLLVYLLFVWQSYRTMDRELTGAVLSQKQSLTQLAAAGLSDKMDSLVVLANSLATRVQFRELIAAEQWLEAGAILDSVPGDFPMLDRVFLTDPEGVLKVDVPALEGGVREMSFAHREWYQGVSRRWEPFISPVYTRAALPQRNVFAVAVPIKTDGGELLGILVLQQELDKFFTWIEGMDIGPEGFIYVVDGMGMLAAHPDYQTAIELIDYSAEPAVRSVLQGNTAVETVMTSDGESVVAAYMPTRYGWAVVVEQPAAMAFAVRDGQLRWVTIEYAVVLLLGALLMWLLIHLLTQQRQIEADRHMLARLEDQWNFFRKVIDLDKNMIFTKDREGRFVLVNQATAEVFGMTVDEMLGKTNSDFMTNPDWIEKFQRDEQEILDTQEEKFFPEVKIRDAGGRVRWLQTVMRPMPVGDGKADMILGVATDITERKHMEDELRKNIERFEMVSRATHDIIWDWDIVNDVVWYNQAFRIVFGYQQDEMGRGIQFCIHCTHPDDRERVQGAINGAIQGRQQSWTEKYRFSRRDGSYAHVLDRGYIVRDESGNAVRMIGAMTDISERHEQELRIARLNRIRQVMSEINTMIVRVRDRETLCHEACRIAIEDGGFVMAWVGMTDPDTQEIRPVAHAGQEHGYLDVARFSVPEDVPEGRNLVSRALRENRPIVVNNISTATGLRYRRELMERDFQSFTVLPLTIGEQAVGTFALYSYEPDIFDEEEVKLLREMAADISFALDHIDKEQRLNYLALHDVLTGLPNRELFIDRLVHDLHDDFDSYVHGLVLIDIERFAYINEALGRHAGDSVLKTLAARLKRVLPESDQTARITTDVFAVLLTGMRDASEVARVLEERLLSELSVPMSIDDEQLQVAVKVGVAVAPHDGRDAETLFKNAEAALKNTKQSGAKYQFYAPRMNAMIAEKLALENSLRQALKNEEFVLAYQPKIDLWSYELVGLEALIRWNSDTGLVPPDKFIPVLEETGLIIEVGQWVIRRAMLDFQAWMDDGLQPPPVAVNISALELRQADFVDRVEALIDGLPDIGSRLELEITETVIMEDLEDNLDKLGRLRDRHIGISIDDFGTGYSSLRYLSRLPITAIKIDRSFIGNMIDSPEDAAIVSTIVTLAHSLGRVVVAEGVESVEQRDVLQRLQCDQYQGYLFSPPLSLEDVETLLRGEAKAMGQGKN